MLKMPKTRNHTSVHGTVADERTDDLECPEGPQLLDDASRQIHLVATRPPGA
jgi:hypothetical protein